MMIKYYQGEDWKELKLDYTIQRKRYLLSNYGRVISYFKSVEEDGRLIKCYPIDGYPSFRYKEPSIKNGEKGVKTVTKYIHKLVAEYYLTAPPSEEYHFVLHLDYDKVNNQVRNLKWANKEQVEKHLAKNPHYIEAKRLRKEKPDRYNTKLSETEVIRLKKKIFDPNRKTRYKILAKQFGISEMQLYRIKTGENWSNVHVTNEPKRD